MSMPVWHQLFGALCQTCPGPQKPVWHSSCLPRACSCIFCWKEIQVKGLREMPGSLCIGGQRRGPEHGYYGSPTKRAIGTWRHWGVITSQPKALSAFSKISMAFPKKQEQERDVMKRTKKTAIYQMCSQSSVVERSWQPVIIRPEVVCQVILCNPVGLWLPTTSRISSTLSLLLPSPLSDFTNTLSTWDRT